MWCASFIQPTIEECEAKSKAPTAAEKRDRIMKRLKAGDRMVYHWKDEGWLEADFLRVCGGRDQQEPQVYKHKLLFLSYSDGARSGLPRDRTAHSRRRQGLSLWVALPLYSRCQERSLELSVTLNLAC